MSRRTLILPLATACFGSTSFEMGNRSRHPLKYFLLLAFLIGAPAGIIRAQTNYYVCTVDVPNARDPIQNSYSGQPTHTYWSLVLQGGDPNNGFLSWARKQFGSRWVKNPYSQSDGVTESCGIPWDTYQDAKAILDAGDDGYDKDTNRFNTRTNWPNVLNP
jgi:hypothetical protein